MGRVQIAKIVQAGGNPHPEYIVDNLQNIGSEIYTPGTSDSMTVALKGYNTSSYPLPIDSDFIYGPCTGRYYMAYNTFSDLSITHSSSNVYEFYIKFKLTSIPSALRDICGMHGILTPDIDTDCKVKLWNQTNSSYSWQSSALTVGDWYYLKCSNDSGSTIYYNLYDSSKTLLDSGNFSDSISSWSNIGTSSTVGWGDFPAGSTSTSGHTSRIFDCGLIDLKESYFAVNGVKKQYFVQGVPKTVYYSDLQGGNN